MNPRAVAAMTKQHGLISRSQALNSGLSEKEVRQLVARGAWVAVRRGVYVASEVWADLDDWVGRPRLRALAVGLQMSIGDFVYSHDSAADLLGLPILRPDRPFVHVTHDWVTGSRNRFGVKHHGAVFHDSQVVEAFGVRCLDLARTAVDLAREHGVRHGLAACDGALRLGASRTQLQKAVEPMDHWRGAPAARLCVELADRGAENVAESLLREVILGLGIGVPETQFEIRDEQRWVRCDVRVGRHIFEFDGRKKYLPPELGGVAADPDRTPWDEKLRQDWLARHRLGTSRVIWAELWEPRLTSLRQRLLQEYLETEQRWGTSIADQHLVVRRGRSA